MSRRRTWALGPGSELAIALAVGGVAGLAIPPVMMDRVDGLLIGFLSVVVAAAIPGVTITVVAQRPPMESELEARRLGASLQDQVRFWFGYMVAGSVGVGALIVAHALSWSLDTPRPAYIPGWVPSDGGAWLVAISVATVVFTVIRLRRVVSAVIDLVDLGTTAHVGESRERRQAVQQAVAEELLKHPVGDPMRGAPVEPRERLPRH